MPESAESGSDAIRICQAQAAADIADVARLFREYQAAISVDLGFQDFEAEVASLPGAYVPPLGRLFLARRAGAPVGCVALKPLGATDGEMKRLYVRPTARGSGAGRRLVETVLSEARAAGYRRLFLDTLPEMITAQGLYVGLGFRETQAYVHNPVPGAKFMVLHLN